MILFILKALLVTSKKKKPFMRAMKNGKTSRPDGNPVEICIRLVAKLSLSTVQAVSANLERKEMVPQDLKDTRLLRHINPNQGRLIEVVNRAS